MFVVKIGGSLLTEKAGYCAANHERITAYAREIARHWHELAGRLVLVIGGGSYGNGVPLRHRMTSAHDAWRHEDLMLMTVKMGELLHLVATALREAGVPCFPFQTSSLLHLSGGRPKRAFLQPIRQALDTGLLPILSGDLVWDEQETFVIYSSDHIPSLFVEDDSFAVQRVVMLTDVPGVLDASGEVIPVITRENGGQRLAEVGHSTHPDVTGGMKTKLQALLTLAARGVEGVLCDGREPRHLAQAMFEESPVGTMILAR